MTSKSSRVVVVGGGAVGLATARALARSGSAVTLLERRRLGGASSSELTGGVRDLFKAKALVELSHLSLDLTADLRDGADLGWAPCGYLYLGTDTSQFDRLPYNEALRSIYRARVERLSRAEIAERYPWFQLDGIVGGAFYGGGGVYTPRLVVEALVEDCRDAGVDLREHAEVTRITVSGGRATAVDLIEGEVEADAIVLATAGWTPTLLSGLAVSLPIVPKRGQLFRVPQPTGTPFPAAFVFDYGLSVYFRPRADGVILGYSDTEVAPTTDPVLTPEDGPRRVALVAKRLPAIAGSAISEGWVGVRDMTPDDHGIISAAPGIEGLYIAAGFGSHGTMHAMGVGATMAALVAGERPPLNVAPFSATRFAANQAVTA